MEDLDDFLNETVDKCQIIIRFCTNNNTNNTNNVLIANSNIKQIMQFNKTTKLIPVIKTVNVSSWGGMIKYDDIVVNKQIIKVNMTKLSNFQTITSAEKNSIIDNEAYPTLSNYDQEVKLVIKSYNFGLCILEIIEETDMKANQNKNNNQKQNTTNGINLNNIYMNITFIYDHKKKDKYLESIQNIIKLI